MWKKKKSGGPIHPQVVAGHPLGHGGGSATTKPAGLGVVEPPLWPKGVAEPPPPVKEKKNVKEGGGGLVTPLGHGGGRDRPVWWWPSHPHGLRGGQPPPVGGLATHSYFSSFTFFYFLFTGGGP